jgi:hypothetical protein
LPAGPGGPTNGGFPSTHAISRGVMGLSFQGPRGGCLLPIGGAEPSPAFPVCQRDFVDFSEVRPRGLVLSPMLSTDPGARLRGTGNPPSLGCRWALELGGVPTWNRVPSAQGPLQGNVRGRGGGSEDPTPKSPGGLSARGFGARRLRAICWLSATGGRVLDLEGRSRKSIVGLFSGRGYRSSTRPEGLPFHRVRPSQAARKP